MLDYSVIADEPAPPPVPDHAPIDFAHLFRMTLGDHGLECEVLRLFDRQAEMLVGRMRGAPAAMVAAFAHTLKGSAGGVGAWQVAQAAAEVEAAALRTADFDPALDALIQATSQARAAITNLLRTN